MQPAARVTDPHLCPLCSGPTPHVGGPVLPAGASPDVFIEGLPAATVGTLCTCQGAPDAIARGSATVFINGLPAARVGDPTVHGGVIIGGAGTVFIGDGAAGPGEAARARRERYAAADGTVPPAPMAGAADGGQPAVAGGEGPEPLWLELEIADRSGLPLGELPYHFLSGGDAAARTLDGNGDDYFDALRPEDHRARFLADAEPDDDASADGGGGLDGD